MKKEIKITTTFIKYDEYEINEGESIENALERARNDADLLANALDNAEIFTSIADADEELQFTYALQLVGDEKEVYSYTATTTKTLAEVQKIYERACDEWRDEKDAEGNHISVSLIEYIQDCMAKNGVDFFEEKPDLVLEF